MSPSTDGFPENWKQFPDGSLLKITLNNFLTYEHTVCTPGENLNLILGHNGSGKSSIICGLCLVFGGCPKILGRSEKLPDYIRYGCVEGYIEVVVSDQEKGPQTIRMTLRAAGKTAEYKLNNAASTQANIKEFAASYNIQIENPCAFLAQDKVKSFSEQSPIELLFNTEKAASAELSSLHNKLIQDRKDSTQIEDKCTTAENTVKQIEDDISKLEPRVESYRQKKKMQTKLQLLEQKIAIIEFNDTDKVYKEEVENSDASREKFETAQHKLKKVQNNVKKYNDMSEKHRTTIHNNKTKRREIMLNLDQALDKDFIQSKLQNARKNYENQKNEQKKIEKRKIETRQRVAMYEVKLKEAEDELSGYNVFNAQSREEEKKNFEEDKRLRQEEDKIGRLAHSKKMIENKKYEKEREQSQVENRRLRMMQSISRDAALAWEYYRSNANLFKDEIFVPIMHVVLKSEDAAKIVENSVGHRDWCMFVCSNKDDELLINDSSKGWRINSTVVRQENVHERHINVKLPDELKDIGFQYFASECIDAPATLKQYLCNVFRLNNIPIGGESVERNLKDISEQMAKTRYSVFMTPNIRTQISVSRYSGEVIQSQGQMRQPNTWTEPCFSRETQRLARNDDLIAEMEDLQRQIDECTKKLSEEKAVVQRSRDRLKQDQFLWRNKKQSAMTAKNNLVSETDKLAQLETEDVDMEKAEEELKREQKAALEGSKKMFENCLKQQQKYLDLYTEFSKLVLVRDHCDSKAAKMEGDLTEMVDAVEELKHAKSMNEMKLQQALTKKKVARDRLKETCSLKHLNFEKMDKLEKGIYKKLTELFESENVPDDEEALEKQLHAERTRLKLVEDSADDGSAEDEKQMERLKHSLLVEVTKRDELLQTKDNFHEKLGEEIDGWRTKVEEMIEKINENYRTSFQKMGCLGEVHLDLPENTLDIESYGIMIMVCFRAGEKMKRLDQKVQSGGERSVSTMLYLLALQQLCPVPFRCVDEINQGMDPTNERKVFEIMVNLWSGDSTLAKTQYFLLTPKLLHGLPMNDRVTVQVVHSVVPQVFTTWNSAKYIADAKAGVAA